MRFKRKSILLLSDRDFSRLVQSEYKKHFSFRMTVQAVAIFFLYLWIYKFIRECWKKPAAIAKSRI